MYNNMKITQLSVVRTSAIDFHHKHYFFFKFNSFTRKYLIYFLYHYNYSTNHIHFLKADKALV